MKWLTDINGVLMVKGLSSCIGANFLGGPISSSNTWIALAKGGENSYGVNMLSTGGVKPKMWSSQRSFEPFACAEPGGGGNHYTTMLPFMILVSLFIIYYCNKKCSMQMWQPVSLEQSSPLPTHTTNHTSHHHTFHVQPVAF